MNKKALRKKLLDERIALSRHIWQSKSYQICEHLQLFLSNFNYHTILSYFSFKQEPDLSYLHQQKKYIWGFSRCVTHDLIWHQWQENNSLNINKYGIYEPFSYYPLMDISTVNIIFVPCVSCDHFGFRLGYGGGFYDRMFEQPLWENVIKIGIIFDFAYQEKLPVESWDKPLNYICTESGITEILHPV